MGQQVVPAANNVVSTATQRTTINVSPTTSYLIKDTPKRRFSQRPTTNSIRRQDGIGSLIPAAIGLAGGIPGSGVSPIGIFSNLLSAYASIDSKHDITGKLINAGASWFSPPTAETKAFEDEDKTGANDIDKNKSDETTTIGTSTSTTTTESPKNIKSTTTVSGTTPTKVDKLV